MACPLINLLFFLLMFLPFSTLAQTSKNISLGSSLTALKDGDSSWPSPTTTTTTTKPFPTKWGRLYES
ncbi:hypothetical protein EV1_005716 [Malus domestica]